MDLKQQTIGTYNDSAIALAEKFNNQGARISDIEFVFSKHDEQNPFVFEIGCGNGRDAVEICKRTHNYIGLDISEKLLELAKEQLPEQKFILADIENFEFPRHIDIVFAFASLIHVPKESFKKILETLFISVENGGLVFISLKHSDHYMKVTKEDEYGTRTYWHYSEQDMHDLASGFSIKNIHVHDIRGQKWMEVLYRKN